MTLMGSNFTGSYRRKRGAERVAPMSFSSDEPVVAAEEPAFSNEVSPELTQPVERTETIATTGSFDTAEPVSAAAVASDPLAIERPFEDRPYESAPTLGTVETDEATETSMFGSPVYQRPPVRRDSRKGLLIGVAAAAVAVAAVGLLLAANANRDETTQTAGLRPATEAAPLAATPAPLAAPTEVATAPAVPTAVAPGRLSVVVTDRVAPAPVQTARVTPRRATAAPRRTTTAAGPALASSDASAQVTAPVEQPAITTPAPAATPAPTPDPIVVPIIE